MKHFSRPPSLGGEKPARPPWRRVRWAHKLTLLVFLLILFIPSAALSQGKLQWAEKGPSGGMVNALIINPQNAAILYAGTNDGVFRSNDGGNTWSVQNSGMGSAMQINVMSLDPQNPDIIYAGTDKGLYRSSDGAGHWTLIGADLAQDIIFALAVDLLLPGVIFAAFPGAGFKQGIHKSTDGGDSWTLVSEEFPEEIVSIWSLAVAPKSSDIVYAGTDHGVFKSVDGGQSWVSATDDVLPSDIPVYQLAIDPQWPDTVYAGTYAGIYRTTDGGTTWVATNNGIDTEPTLALIIDPVDPNIIYASMGGISPKGLCRSTNRGEDWTWEDERTTDLDERMILALAINPRSRRVIYKGTGSGIYRSNDAGTTWDEINQGLVNVEIRQLAVDPCCAGHLYAATLSGIYATTDGGDTWTTTNEGLLSKNVLHIIVDPESPGCLYASSWEGQIYVSKDAGANWGLVIHGFNSDTQVSDMAVWHPPGEDEEPSWLFASTSNDGVWLSRDQEHNIWIDANVPVTETSSLLITALDVLYVGTQEGIYRLILTTDLDEKGLGWESVSNGLPQSAVTSMVSDPRDTMTMYAATDIEGIWKTEDGGETWRQIGQGTLPTRVRVESLALSPRKRGAPVLYAGIYGGLFRSEDGGESWIGENQGLRKATVSTVAADPSEPGSIYVGTTNSGVFHATDDALRGVSSSTIALIVATGIIAVGYYVARHRSWSLSSRQQPQEVDYDWGIWERLIGKTFLQHNEVTIAMLDTVPSEVREKALEYYVSQHPEQDIVRRRNPTRIEPANFLPLQRFARNWNAAQSRLGSASFEPVAASLVDQLCDLLGFTRLETRSYKNLHGYVVKASALRLRIPSRFPIIFLPQQTFTSEDIDGIQDLMRILGMTSYFAIVIQMVDSVSHPGRKRALEQALGRTAHDLIVLNYRDLWRMFIAQDTIRCFIDIILSQVDLTVVSPYVISGPVPENMFFGRDYELKAIIRTIRDHSFAIVGGRKIGKTSILAKVYRLMAEMADFHPLYLDCQAINSYDGFFETLGAAWDIIGAKPSPEAFRRLIYEVWRNHPRNNVVVLLDEVDALLKYDQKNEEKLFRVFRALSQEERCRFVFCGERVLNARLHASDSPLFNFGNSIRLSYLTPEATARIINDPMREMGVEMEETDKVVERIVEISSCHPNIVQYICQQAIVHINKAGVRTITPDEIEAVVHSDAFIEYFVEVTWGNATLLEKIISLTLLDEDEAGLTHIQELILRSGITVNPDTLETALTGLCLCSLMDKKGESYYFAARSFPVILKERANAEMLLDSLARKYLASNQLTIPALPQPPHGREK